MHIPITSFSFIVYKSSEKGKGNRRGTGKKAFFHCMQKKFILVKKAGILFLEDSSHVYFDYKVS